MRPSIWVLLVPIIGGLAQVAAAISTLIAYRRHVRKEAEAREQIKSELDELGLGLAFLVNTLASMHDSLQDMTALTAAVERLERAVFGDR